MIKLTESKVYFRDRVVPFNEAQLSIASSAILYGLSVYTVFPLTKTEQGLAVFRLKEHFERLKNSCRIIGITTFEEVWNFDSFEAAVKELVAANDIATDMYIRATVHVDELVAGSRSRDLSSLLSIFMYEAKPILSPQGSKVKTSVWRRVPDDAIPARAKVNGAYVNSVLAKQEALDNGFDDCVFLDRDGHVCELSAANIFLVRNNTLITPGNTSDVLEGINRQTLIDYAKEQGIAVEERTVDVTELYIADEVFASGTSALISPIINVDKRTIGNGSIGPITKKLSDFHASLLAGTHDWSERYLTYL